MVKVCTASTGAVTSAADPGLSGPQNPSGAGMVAIVTMAGVSENTNEHGSKNFSQHPGVHTGK